MELCNICLELCVLLCAVILVLRGSVISAETCVCLKNVTDQLFNPIAMVTTDNGFFIAEQRGTIRYFTSTGAKSDIVTLDIKGRVLTSTELASEQGLLGFALHPRYGENGKLYVFYLGATSTEKFSQLSEFITKDNVADPSSERYLLRISKYSNSGNGGQLFFGHDGYLYISVGDGVGDVGFKHDGAQDPTSLLGKILRIDVDSQSFTNGSALSYGIPASNPFYHRSPWRQEVFAYGCRDMWRCSQDLYPTDNGERRIFCGDTGANSFEEINLIQKGGNYGWNIKEGNSCTRGEGCQTLDSEVLPIYSYPHSDPYHAVVGGYVYRGADIPDLTGKYIFGDALVGNMSVLTEDNGQWSGDRLSVCPEVTCPCDARDSLRHFILGFSQDTTGEVYVLTTSSLDMSISDGIALKLTRSLIREQTTCDGNRQNQSLIVIFLMVTFMSMFH